MSTIEKRLKGKLLGVYRLLKRIGDESAQAAVFRSKNIHTGREVAVKVRLEPNPNQRHAFDREAEIHSSLDHPNIVPIEYYGYSSRHDAIYIAMDLIKDGWSLRKVLEERTVEDQERTIVKPLEVAKVIIDFLPISRCPDTGS